MNPFDELRETPWGPPQQIETLIFGQVYWVTTAGHGGLYVRGDALGRIPEVFRRATFTGSEHWYEEDIDWAIVCHFVAEVLPSRRHEAESVLRNCHGETYKTWEATCS